MHSHATPVTGGANRQDGGAFCIANAAASRPPAQQLSEQAPPCCLIIAKPSWVRSRWLFWQNGHGSNAIYGVPATGSIRNWIPIVTFAFLFGISMDYEVFILARMREEYDRTGSTKQTVVGSLAHTGRLVTCAALILAISFVSLTTNPDIVVQMIASGLAFGVLVDALVVRTLLVPELVAIMDHWNWWMPTGLARLLRLPATASIEEPTAA
jgi:RND superfamily putative drug exporter